MSETCINYGKLANHLNLEGKGGGKKCCHSVNFATFVVLN